MAWAVELLGCHSWRSRLRAARDWESPARLGQDVAVGDDICALLLGGFAPSLLSRSVQ